MSLSPDELITMAGDPNEWRLMIICRGDGDVVVWGDDDLDPADAAQAVCQIAAAMSIKYPGGSPPDEWAKGFTWDER